MGDWERPFVGSVGLMGEGKEGKWVSSIDSEEFCSVMTRGGWVGLDRGGEFFGGGIGRFLESGCGTVAGALWGAVVILAVVGGCCCCCPLGLGRECARRLEG